MHDFADDWRLLKEYVDSGSHNAFAAIVNRYVDMVYSASLRQVRGDRHLAEDVTQAAFIALSIKAKQLAPRGSLAVWLLRAAHFAANNALKVESRRRRHELRAAQEYQRSATVMNPHSEQDIGASFDQALLRLGRADCEVLVLRYFKGLNLDETASALNISKLTAAKRVSRALERLKRLLQQRGCASLTTAGLSSWLAADTIQAAPAGFGGSILSSINPGAAAPAAVNLLAQGAIKMMTLAKLKFVAMVSGIGVLFLAAGVAVIAQITAPAPPIAIAAPTITGAQWMEDINAGSGVSFLLANTNRIITIPKQTPDAMEMVNGTTITEAEAELPDPAQQNLIIKIVDLTDFQSHRIGVYLFPTEPWPSPARYTTGGEANQLTGVIIPPGKYMAIAIEGSWDNFQMVGLPVDWPRPIEIVEGKVARLEVRMSPALSRTLRSSSSSRDAISDLNERTMRRREMRVQGKVIDALGRPMAGATVQIRNETSEQPSGRRTIDFAESMVNGDISTNANGFYGLPGAPTESPYHVGAGIMWPTLDLPGYRSRWIMRNEILRARQEVDFTIPKWPTQTATVKGHVIDSQGRDVDAFIVGISSNYWPKVGGADLPIDNWSIRAGFEHGRFEIKDVPVGPSQLFINPAQRSQQHPSSAGRFTQPPQTIGVKSGEVLEVEVKLAEQGSFVPPRGRPGGGGGRRESFCE